MLNNKKYKIGLFVVKYAPVLMGLILYLYTILSLMGIYVPHITSFVGSSVLTFIIMLALSNMLKFCIPYKCMSMYILIVSICINYEIYTFVFLILSLVIGTILFILLYKKSPTQQLS